MSAEHLTVAPAPTGSPARPLTARVGRLRAQALAGPAPRSSLRAQWSRELLEPVAADPAGGPLAEPQWTTPRPVQIARLLYEVCDRMPIHLAPGELIVGKRTVEGWPEIGEAVRLGSAEPGYMIADYATVVRRGLLALIAEGEARLAAADPSGPHGAERCATRQSQVLACRAALRLAERHAEACRAAAQQEADPARRAELQELARICAKVPAHPAETFHEALQSLWLAHLAIYLECDDVGFALGRTDQYLNPFYLADVQAGRLDRDRAVELLECLWVKLYENVQGAIGHVQTVTVGGYTPDGGEGVNETTWLIQQAARDMATVGPSVATRYTRRTPPELLDYLLQTMLIGAYMPQIYNDEQMVPALVGNGVPAPDAREYGLIGCHEPSICGQGYFRSASWPGYFCLPECLELALGNGCKLDTGERRGPATGDPAEWESFEDLRQAFVAQIFHMVAEKVRIANQGEAVKQTLTPRPMMSALTRDCLAQGVDFTAGGARYNFSGFQAFGLGTVTDSLAALRRICFEQRELSPAQFVQVLRDNWEGHEELRRRVQAICPHWGNDDDQADELGAAAVAALQAEIARHTNARGGRFLLGLWSFWQHVGYAPQVAASADGRRHGERMSHSMDPGEGRALHGPTAALRSAGKLDTSLLANGGSLLLEFHPDLLATAAGRQAVIALIRTYFAQGGIQLQLSCVSPETLEAAMQNPDQYRHLVVRVAGYCDFFVRQSPEGQAYILAREKHGAV